MGGRGDGRAATQSHDVISASLDGGRVGAGAAARRVRVRAVRECEATAAASHLSGTGTVRTELQGVPPRISMWSIGGGARWPWLLVQWHGGFGPQHSFRGSGGCAAETHEPEEVELERFKLV